VSRTARINWRREVAIGAARRQGEKYANIITALAVARRVAAPILVAVASLASVVVLARQTQAFLTSTLWLSSGLALLLIVAGVATYRRLSRTRGYYLPVANAAVALFAVVAVSLGSGTLIVWLAS
jgi:hypothetical protein